MFIPAPGAHHDLYPPLTSNKRCITHPSSAVTSFSVNSMSTEVADEDPLTPPTSKTSGKSGEFRVAVFGIRGLRI